MYNHYIRINEASEVIAAYSDAFQTPEPDDILITPEGTGERHFNLSLQVRGVYAYTWDGKELVERTPEDIDIIALPREEVQQAKARLAQLDTVIPRALEDLYKATGKTPYTTVQAVIDEKNKLRNDYKGAL
jgi:hypothetical protein